MKVVKNPARQQDGYFPIPDTPGMGIDLNEEAMKQFPYIEKSYEGVYYKDGGIADV
jgi:L-alanine-DL-glutamate epimerase-like enolase superfamily enzyme